MNRFQAIGIGLLAGFLTLGAASFLPVFETHSHLGEGDEVVLIPRDPDGPFERTLEPAYDFYRAVNPREAHAHRDFAKFCGHYAAAIPNHNYYYKKHWWYSGTHYHKGYMSHVFGADYNYKFVCGKSGNHFPRWPK